jgi:hypothetical protein
MTVLSLARQRVWDQEKNCTLYCFLKKKTVENPYKSLTVQIKQNRKLTVKIDRNFVWSIDNLIKPNENNNLKLDWTNVSQKKRNQINDLNLSRIIGENYGFEKEKFLSFILSDIMKIWLWKPLA